MGGPFRQAVLLLVSLRRTHPWSTEQQNLLVSRVDTASSLFTPTWRTPLPQDPGTPGLSSGLGTREPSSLLLKDSSKEGQRGQ